MFASSTILFVLQNTVISVDQSAWTIGKYSFHRLRSFNCWVFRVLFLKLPLLPNDESKNYARQNPMWLLCLNSGVRSLLLSGSSPFFVLMNVQLTSLDEKALSCWYRWVALSWWWRIYKKTILAIQGAAILSLFRYNGCKIQLSFSLPF